ATAVQVRPADQALVQRVARKLRRGQVAILARRRTILLRRLRRLDLLLRRHAAAQTQQHRRPQIESSRSAHRILPAPQGRPASHSSSRGADIYPPAQGRQERLDPDTLIIGHCPPLPPVRPDSSPPIIPADTSFQARPLTDPSCVAILY